jgi:hypothetical protein
MFGKEHRFSVLFAVQETALAVRTWSSALTGELAWWRIIVSIV